MNSEYYAGYSEGRRPIAGGRGSIFLGICFLVLFTMLSYFFQDRLGMMGLIILGAGILGGVCGLILLLRFPIWLGMLWFLSMSGLQTLGMLRMPGLPDFSFSRLFLMAVLVLLPIGILKGKAAIRAPSLPDLLLLAYTFYVFLNMNTLGDPLRFNTWLASCFAPAVAYFFARQYVDEENHLRAIFLFLILVTVYFWVTSFGEHFEKPQFVWPRIIMDREYGNSWYGRSRGPFIQPAVFGQLIGMYLIIHLYLLTRNIRRIWKLLIVANIGFGLVGLLYTYTRGGWLATAFGFIILAILRPNFRKIMFVVAGIGLLVGVLGLLQPKDDEFLAERMETTNTIDNRLGFLANAMRMIRDKPLFGVGYFRFNDYRHLYNQGTTIPLYGFVKRKAGANVSIHDIYIGRAAEEGLVGLFLYLSFYGLIGLHFLRRWKRHPKGRWFDKDMLAMLAAFFGAYFIGGMVIDYRYFDLINVLPAFFAGVIVGFPEPLPKTARPVGLVSVPRSGS